MMSAVEVASIWLLLVFRAFTHAEQMVGKVVRIIDDDTLTLSKNAGSAQSSFDANSNSHSQNKTSAD